MARASHSNNLNVGMKCIKYMLFTINFMFVLTAIMIISIGVTIQTIYADFEIFIDDHFMSPPTLMVAIGILLLLVSSFGCVGAIRESTMLINVYGLLLGGIFILEISAAIAAFALHSQIPEMLTRTMTQALNLYPTKEYVQDSVNLMQEFMECCGINGKEDWQGIIPSADDNFIQLPDSCYVDSLGNSSDIFEDGCFDRMKYLVSQSAMLVALGAITVAFVQLLGVICAFMLAKTIRQAKSQRLARRWQLQQNLGIYNKPTPLSPYSPPYVALNDETKSPQQDEKNFTYLPNSPSVN